MESVIFHDLYEITDFFHYFGTFSYYLDTTYFKSLNQLFLLGSSMTTLKSTMKIVNYSSSCKKNIQSSRKLSMNLICVPTAKTSLHFASWTLSNDYLGKYSFKILESNTFGLGLEFEIWRCRMNQTLSIKCQSKRSL